MPFDTANIDLAPAFSAPTLSDLAAAFDREAPSGRDALANPNAALAFLLLSPRPCAALDVLLAA